MAAPPTYYTQFVRVAFNQQIGGPEYPLLFLHERVTPAGQKHLVTVSLLADFQFDQPRTRPREAGIGGPYGGYGGYGDREAPRGLKIQPGETVFVMKKRRLLSVVTYLVDGPRTPDGGYRGRGSAMTRSVNLELPDSKSWVVGRVMENTGGDAGGSGEPKLDTATACASSRASPTRLTRLTSRSHTSSTAVTARSTGGSKTAALTFGPARGN